MIEIAYPGRAGERALRGRSGARDYPGSAHSSSVISGFAVKGFEAGEGWAGAPSDATYFYEGALSRRLAVSPASHLNTYLAYPINPPLDLSAATAFTIQTMLRNGSPGFWSCGLNLVLREGVTFNTITLSFPLAFNYQDGLNVWLQRSVAVDWFGFYPDNVVEIVWNLSSFANFGGGLGYIDDWRALGGGADVIRGALYRGRVR